MTRKDIILKQKYKLEITFKIMKQLEKPAM